MRYALAIAALLLLAAPAAAKVMLCNATKASTTCGNVCATATDGVLSYSLSRVDPDGAGPKLTLSDEVAAALCDRWNYQATLADGAPNPESCTAFGDRMLAEQIREVVIQYRRKLKDAEAAAELQADPVPPVQ